jgi:hypothetical protein
VRIAAISLDRIDQRLEFVRAAARDTGNVAFLRKTLGNGAASSITRADNQYDLLVIHGLIPLMNDR